MSREQYARHRTKTLAAVKAYQRAHPEVGIANGKRRRAAKAGSIINDFSAAQWIEPQIAFDHRCAYCGKRAKGHLTQDHITPVTQGGNHTLKNIVPSCRSCNSKKWLHGPLVPVQPLLFTFSLPRQYTGEIGKNGKPIKVKKEREPSPLRPCKICEKLCKVLLKGRCVICYNFWKKHAEAKERSIFTPEEWNMKKRGMNSPVAKLTDEDVRSIRLLSSLGISAIDISKRFKIVHQNVSNIIKRRSWRHID